MVSERLIAGCMREDRKAQYELYRVLYPMMMSICSRYEKNKADVLARMNNGFLKILQNIGERNKEVPFEPWARRIMINTVIDEYRRERKRTEMETIGLPVDNGSSASLNDYLKEMESDAFDALLMKLPTMTRNVFNLFAIDGFSHAEIADLFGISIGTSKWHVSHARSVLQQALMAVARKNITLR